MCISYQDKIEYVLTKKFSTLWERFIDKKLSIHFWEDKIKCILFSKTKYSSKLNLTYNNHNIEQ